LGGNRNTGAAIDGLSLPFEIARLPRQRLLLGYLVSALGPLWMVGSILLAIGFVDHPAVPAWVGLPLYGFGLYLIAEVALRIRSYGKRLRQPDAVSVLSRDSCSSARSTMKTLWT